jgi:hypothetical protein
MTDSKKDVEMINTEEKKEEKKEVVQEPHDPFFGKFRLYSLCFRYQEEPCALGKGCQGKGFQVGCYINQIIQKT